jgi:hypothetical protein
LFNDDVPTVTVLPDDDRAAPKIDLFLGVDHVGDDGLINSIGAGSSTPENQVESLGISLPAASENAKGKSNKGHRVHGYIILYISNLVLSITCLTR